jgi:hypothetical protein
MPLAFQNRVLIRHEHPDGTYTDHCQQGNILVTYGLNNLVEKIAAGSASWSGSQSWVRAMVLGNSNATDAIGYSDVSIGNAGSTKAQSSDSLVSSDAGARTLEYQATFSDGDAYEIHTVALFGTTGAAYAGSMIGAILLTGANTVNKGTGDTVNVSYQVIAQSA